MLDPRLRYALSRLLKQDVVLRFDQQATRSQMLYPQRSSTRPMGIMLPGQIDRARSTTPSSSMEQQKSIALGGSMTHLATTLYVLPNARIEHTALYCNGRRKSYDGLGFGEEIKLSGSAPRIHMACGLLISTHQGLTYFGDWLFENCSRVLLAKELGEAPFAMTRRNAYQHAPRYRELFQLQFQEIARASFDELIVVDDWGHPPEKADRYRQLRDRIRRSPGRQQGHDVFVIRGRSGQARVLSNEQACIEWAQQRGFSIVDPSKMSVDELIYELKDARCVAGVEGSGLLHGLVAMASDGFLLAIVAADRFIVSSKEYADALNIPFALVVADKGDLNGFEVDIQELNATYELALRNRF